MFPMQCYVYKSLPQVSNEVFPQNQNQGIVLVISENCEDLRDLFTNLIQFGKEKIIVIAGIHCAKSVDVLKEFLS